MANVTTNIPNLNKIDLNKVFPEMAELFQSNTFEDALSQLNKPFSALSQAMTFQTVNTATEQSGYFNGDFISVKGSNLTSSVLTISQIDFKSAYPTTTLSINGKIVIDTNNAVITGYMDKFELNNASYSLSMNFYFDIATATGSANHFVINTFNESISVSGKEIDFYNGKGIDNLTVASKKYSLVLQGDMNFNSTLFKDFPSFMSGDDLIEGAGNNQFITGYAGNDNLNAGYGDDTLDGGTGNDILNGGLGTNTAVFSGYKSSYSVSKSGATYSISNAFDGADTLSNIQFLQFTDGTIAIDSALPKLVITPPPVVIEMAKPVISTKPTSGNDQLTGTSGNDKLSGLEGNDKLIGGLGVDTLTGGKGADVFKFNDIKETGLAVKTRDTITDFKTSEGDKIDLSGIDANTNRASDQAFTKLGIGAKFSGKFSSTGQLFFDTTTQILWGNVDTKAGADFSIQLNGVSSLVATDFVL